jgi:hypothetical protein
MMGKRSKRFLFLLVAAALLVCASLAFLDSVRYPVLGWWRDEPFFDGMPASYYADCYLRRRSRPSEGSMERVFDSPEAVPVQQRLAEQSNPQLRYAALRALGKHGGMPVQQWLALHSNSSLRYSALMALGRQGPTARCAIDVVLDNFKGDNAPCQLAAAFALARIEPARSHEPVQFLVGALRGRDKWQAQHAADALERIGDCPGTRQALPDLIAFAKAPGETQPVRSAVEQLVGRPAFAVELTDDPAGTGRALRDPMTFVREPEEADPARTAVQRLVWSINPVAAALVGVPDPEAWRRDGPNGNWVLALLQQEPWPRLGAALAAGAERPNRFVIRPVRKYSAAPERWPPLERLFRR